MNTMANFCRMQSLARKALVQTKHFYVMSAALSIMHLLNLNDRLLFLLFLFLLSFTITMYFNLVYSVSRLILLIYLLLFLFLFIFSLTFVLPYIKHTSLILLLESRISSQKLMPSFCPLNVTFLLLLTLALPF